MAEEQQASYNGWARVEVMGHQTHIGYVRTEAYGQAVMFRVDTPELPEREYVLEEPEYASFSEAENLTRSQWVPAGSKVLRKARDGCSVLVGAGSIYRILPCTEAAALKAIDQTSRPELKLISLPEGKALPSPEQQPTSYRDAEDDDPDAAF